MTTAAAVIRNPWTGRGFVDDLRPEIMAVAPEPGRCVVAAVLDACGGADGVEACGKTAVVGTGGEIEHASALIHTLRFGNLYREAVGGKSYLSFTNKRGRPGCAIAISSRSTAEPWGSCGCKACRCAFTDIRNRTVNVGLSLRSLGGNGAAPPVISPSAALRASDKR